MSNLKHQLRKARPSLKMVSPLAHWTVMIMAVFNILLGASLLLLIDQNRLSAPLIIVNSLFTYKFWGIVFITIGVMKIYALLSNRWGLARLTLMLGVSVKAAWAVALIIRILVSPGTFFITLLWCTIALLQMGAYIWFLPSGMLAKSKD